MRKLRKIQSLASNNEIKLRITSVRCFSFFNPFTKRMVSIFFASREKRLSKTFYHFNLCFYWTHAQEKWSEMFHNTTMSKNIWNLRLGFKSFLCRPPLGIIIFQSTSRKIEFCSSGARNASYFWFNLIVSLIKKTINSKLVCKIRKLWTRLGRSEKA